MQKIKKRTKIIATLGPKISNKDMIKQLILKGVTCIRLNFSHGTEQEHLKQIQLIKKIREELLFPVSIMLDTKGPEIRIGHFKNKEQIFLPNETIKIFFDYNNYLNRACNAREITMSVNVSENIKVGNQILFDDGKLITIVSKVEKDIVYAICQNNHTLTYNKRVNIIGTSLGIPFLSKKDKNDILFGIKHEVDLIATSFTSKAEELLLIKDILHKNNADHIKIYAKIESQEGIDNIEEIIVMADGVMVARGDLGIEIPYYELPVATKKIIRIARKHGKPVIVATQMLGSMENNPLPTRAEVSDVYFAVELGADCTMLSGETAIGKYPIQSVRVMAKINKTGEREFYKKLYYQKQLNIIINNSFKGKWFELSKEIAFKTIDGDYPLIIVLSNTTFLLNEIAKFRPNTNIIGIIKDKKLIHKYGVMSSVYICLDTSNYEKIMNKMDFAKQIAASYGTERKQKFLLVIHMRIFEMEV